MFNPFVRAACDSQLFPFGETGVQIVLTSFRAEMICRIHSNCHASFHNAKTPVCLRTQKAPKYEALPIKAIRKHGCQANYSSSFLNNKSVYY
jgi:hypothetical protein